MNNKQKVLKILDKHRDMSLTMGCEIKRKKSIYTVLNLHKYKGMNDLVVTVRYVGNKEFKCNLATFDVKILGHPATPLTLLKALGDVEKDGDCWWFIDQWGNIEEHNTGDRIATIPDVTTLTELPHTHKLWTDLLPILS